MSLVLLRFLVRSVGSSPSVFKFLVLLEMVWKMAIEFVPSLLMSYAFLLSAPPFSLCGELIYVYSVFVPPVTRSAE